MEHGGDNDWLVVGVGMRWGLGCVVMLGCDWVSDWCDGVLIVWCVRLGSLLRYVVMW